MPKYHLSIATPIEAPTTKIWDALTRPDLIKKYFFGTQVDTDWKPGNAIYFRGEWQGKPYEDKGQILEFIPHKKISFSYFSGFSGLPDLPENYQTVTYELRTEAGKTLLTLSQDNIATSEMKEHSGKNWRMVLEGLKNLVE